MMPYCEESQHLETDFELISFCSKRTAFAVSEFAFAMSEFAFAVTEFAFAVSEMLLP